MLNYYDILGVPKAATPDQIKRAYREQIKFFHPDVFEGSHEVARIKTLQLNEAYATLHDPDRRREYDFQLEYEQRKAAQGERERREKQARAEREQRQRQEAQERAAEQEEDLRRAQEQAEAHRQTEEQERQRTEEEPEAQERAGTDHDDGYAPNVETKAEPEKIAIKTRRTDKGFMPILLTASMGVGCVALAILCVVLWTDIKQMKNDMNELTSKNELLEKEIENWDHKYTSMKSAKDGLLSEVRELRESTEKMGFNDFFVRCAIGLIYDGDDTYFHTTQCDNSPDSTFFVMTSKACDTLGLSPCPYCHTSEDLITIQSLIKQ